MRSKQEKKKCMVALRIGGGTVYQTPLDWEGNFQNHKNSLETAKNQGVELLCFPELSMTGYGSEELFLSNGYIKKIPYLHPKAYPMYEFNVDPKTWYRIPILSGGYREELQELETMEEE